MIFLFTTVYGGLTQHLRLFFWVSTIIPRYDGSPTVEPKRIGISSFPLHVIKDITTIYETQWLI
jgi:hypothetical protein